MKWTRWGRHLLTYTRPQRSFTLRPTMVSSIPAPWLTQDLRQKMFSGNGDGLVLPAGCEEPPREMHLLLLSRTQSAHKRPQRVTSRVIGKSSIGCANVLEDESSLHGPECVPVFSPFQPKYWHKFSSLSTGRVSASSDSLARRRITSS